MATIGTTAGVSPPIWVIVADALRAATVYE